MNKLKNKYVIGTHVMFFEIEMYKDFIDGMINLLETVWFRRNNAQQPKDKSPIKISSNKILI